MNDQNIVGVVLAGGRSRRMGYDKATARAADGRSFLTVASQRLRSLCDVRWCSGWLSNRESSAGFNRVIPDGRHADDEGPIGGILTCMHIASDDGFQHVLFTPLDTPNLTAASLQRLIDTANHGGTAALAFSDRLQPLIGVYPTSCLPTLQRFFDAGGRSPAMFWNDQPHHRIDLPVGECDNINTPAELAAMRANHQ